VIDGNGCTAAANQPVTVNPLPVAQITPDGSTTFCEGGSVTLTASGGTGYLWSTTETTASITVNTTGLYSVTVTDGNGCTAATSQPVTVNPLPVEFSVTGSGSYCEGDPGVMVGLSGSQSGVDYTLSPGGIVVAGTGSPIDFGIQPAGAYTVFANDPLTDCGRAMNGSAVITMYPNPILVVTNPAPVCAPGTADLTASAITAGSTLYGATLSYWMDADALIPMSTPTTAGAGIYYIKATTLQGCTDIEPVTVTANPMPVLIITNPAPVCSPNTVNLTAASVTAGSDPGLSLSYWLNAAATIPVPNPGTVSSGIYYIRAVNVYGCSDVKPVTAAVNPLPTMFGGTGGGSYCAGGPGLELGLSGSQVGVVYTLFHGCCIQVSASVIGTGGPISFGYQTQPGAYSVLAEDMTTHCVNWMFNCISITIDQPLPVSASITASANPVNSGAEVTFTASVVNGGAAPTYQWKLNGLNAGTNSSAFTYVPVDGDEVWCVVTSSLSCVSGNPATSNVVVMEVLGLSGIVSVSGIVSPGKERCYSATQTLIIAGSGTSFFVETGGSATMIAGWNIRYMPGTTVQTGGYMHGYITTSNQFCHTKEPAIPSAITGEEPLLQDGGSIAFKIYPNPTKGNFTIEQTKGMPFELVTVEVYGTRGEKLMTGTMERERKHEFKATDLPYGLYFVRIMTENHTETFKLVKTR